MCSFGMQRASKVATWLLAYCGVLWQLRLRKYGYGVAPVWHVFDGHCVARVTWARVKQATFAKHLFIALVKPRQRSRSSGKPNHIGTSRSCFTARRHLLTSSIGLWRALWGFEWSSALEAARKASRKAASTEGKCSATRHSCIGISRTIWSCEAA